MTQIDEMRGDELRSDEHELAQVARAWLEAMRNSINETASAFFFSICENPFNLRHLRSWQ